MKSSSSMLMYNVKEEKLENVRRTDVLWFQGEHFTFFGKCTVVTPSSPSTFREIKSKFKKYSYIFYVCGCMVYMHICAPYVLRSHGGEDIGPFGIGVTGGCEAPCRC